MSAFKNIKRTLRLQRRHVTKMLESILDEAASSDGLSKVTFMEKKNELVPCMQEFEKTT